MVVDFQWRWSVWKVLGAKGLGGRFREGFRVFLGSGRRVRELETSCFQVCKPNFFFWIQNLSFVPSKSTGFQWSMGEGMGLCPWFQATGQGGDGGRG